MNTFVVFCVPSDSVRASVKLTILVVFPHLQLEVERLVKFVAILGITTGIIFFCIGIARACTDPGGCDSDSIVNAFVNGFILVLVANVPEGMGSIPLCVVDAKTGFNGSIVQL